MKNKLFKAMTGVMLILVVALSSVGMESAAASAATYTVKSGDTLSKIASVNGTTYQKLMTLNNLKSTQIKVGQKLVVNQPTATVSKVVFNNTISTSKKVVAVANTFLGAKYTYGGSSPKAGFDCSGFITYVLNQSGKSTVRMTAAGFYSSSTKVSKPQVGDLVFFSGTSKQNISHVGIYIGNNKMISASGSQVQVANIYGNYWGKYFTGFGRI